MNYLIDVAPPNFKGTFLFHTVTWFKKGGNNHRDVGYSSDDQATVDLQLDLILKYGKGFPASQLGVIVDLYNPADKAAHMLLAGCEKRGMKFSLCFDKGISHAASNTEMLAAVQAAKGIFFGSPAFTKDENGKLFCIEFSAGYADWNAIAIQYGLHVCHWRNDKVNGYSWIRPGATAHATLISENAQVYMPSVSPGFDDHSIKDPTKSVWGIGPARKADYENGALWLAAWKSIPATAKFVQIPTLNDHEERTSVLGNLGFPGLPADLYLPLGNAIPNVFADPLPGVAPTPPAPAQDAFVSRAEWNVLQDRLKKAGIP